MRNLWCIDLQSANLSKTSGERPKAATMVALLHFFSNGQSTALQFANNSHNSENTLIGLNWTIYSYIPNTGASFHGSKVVEQLIRTSCKIYKNSNMALNKICSFQRWRINLNLSKVNHRLINIITAKFHSYSFIAFLYGKLDSETDIHISWDITLSILRKRMSTSKELRA